MAAVAAAAAAVEVRAGAGGRQEDTGRARRRPTSAPRRWRRRGCARTRRRRAGRRARAGAGRVPASTPPPVRASKPRTLPEGAATRPLSLIAEPTITTPCAATGAEEIWNSPGQSSWSVSSRTSPSVPKPRQPTPVLASSANSRASTVPAKMRTAQVSCRRPPRSTTHRSPDRATTRRRDSCIDLRGAAIGCDARVVAPEFAAARRIERNDFIERRAEDQLVGDEDRRRLELDALHQRGIAARLVAGSIDPSTAQVGNVAWRDLAGRAVAAAALVGAVERPAGGGGVRRVRLAADQQRCDGTTKSPQEMAPDTHGLLTFGTARAAAGRRWNSQGTYT